MLIHLREIALKIKTSVPRSEGLHHQDSSNVSFRIKGPPFGSSGLQLEFKILLDLNLGIGIQRLRRVVKESQRDVLKYKSIYRHD